MSKIAPVCKVHILLFLCFSCVYAMHRDVDFQRGMNFLNGQWSPQKYNTSDAHASLQSLAKQTNASYVALSFAVFQPTIDASHPIFAKDSTPKDEELESIVAYAHSQGIKVMLRLLVDPDWSNPHLQPGDWRGMIGRNFTTNDWNTWFEEYNSQIYHYAELAQRVKAEQFCVGGELIIASHQESHWRSTVAGVRSRYDGLLMYAANHGNENDVKWWDAVDVIGIDAYYPLLPDTEDPSVQQLVKAWEPIATSLGALSSRYSDAHGVGKPVVFAEVGYCSVIGANTDPAHCGSSTTKTYSEESQVKCYEALFQALLPHPWFAGTHWWAWLSSPNDTGHKASSFTPSGKAAAAVVQKYYTQL